MGSPTSLSRFVARLGRSRGAFHIRRPARVHGDVQNPARLPFSVTPSVIAVRQRCRNVHLLCIDYASRPRLSSRLTLGGLASPRKPWTYGGRISRAARVTHASILTSGRSTARFPCRFTPYGALPYHRIHKDAIRRFGTMLSPVYCRRMSTRPVSCYALFE